MCDAFTFCFQPLAELFSRICLSVGHQTRLVLADRDVKDDFKSEHLLEMAGWLANLLQCHQKDVSNAASW